MAKIKYSDIKQRNKILMTVVWSHLKGNKKPYLSVDIKQVIHNGDRVHDWDAQKKAIKVINNDLGFLVDSHLCSPDGYGMHMVSNTIYFFEQTKKHTLQPPTSKETLQRQLEDQRNKVINLWHKYLDTIKMNFDNSWNDGFLNLLANDFANVNKFIDQLNKLHLGFTFASIKHNGEKVNLHKIPALLKTFVEYYRQVKKQINKELLNAVNESDIWTIDRFSVYSGIHTDQVKELFFDPNYKDTLKSISEIKAEKAQKRLDTLTKQYNIETVHG